MNKRLIVLKVGTNTLTAPQADHSLDTSAFRSIADQIKELLEDNCDVLVVSSGAIGLGIDRAMPGSTRSSVLAKLSVENQALRLRTLASIGQVVLTPRWQEALQPRIVSQHLITNRELASKEATAFAETLVDSMHMGVVPIVNENDAISDEEIRVGDNDTLAARVAVAIKGLDAYKSVHLILLSDVDGFLGHSVSGSKPILIRRVSINEITTLRATAGGDNGNGGTGGMRTKLDAAEIAGEAGIETHIANGRLPGIIQLALNRESGTHFYL